MPTRAHAAHHHMPANPDEPETRAEARADRATILEQVIDLPGRVEKRSMKWFIIALTMLVFMMGGAAVYYFQKQVESMRAENIGLRDQLTAYLVSANLSTVAALDRNTSALRDQTQTNREVREVLTQLLAKRP